MNCGKCCVNQERDSCYHGEEITAGWASLSPQWKTPFLNELFQEVLCDKTSKERNGIHERAVSFLWCSGQPLRSAMGRICPGWARTVPFFPALMLNHGIKAVLEKETCNIYFLCASVSTCHAFRGASIVFADRVRRPDFLVQSYLLQDLYCLYCAYACQLQTRNRWYVPRLG